MVKKVSSEIGGKELTIETGKMAKQSDGSVTVRYGETVILATAVCAKNEREGIDFFPLTVDYREKTYAAGKIPGGYFKREGRPTEKEILTSRLIDRPIRPLFPDNFFREVQIMASVLSIDDENNPDVLALIGASTALSISKIPFQGPIGAVRIGQVNGEFVVQPSFKEIEEGTLDLVAAGTKDNIVMIESGAAEISDSEFIKALEIAKKEISKIIDLQLELVEACGKEKEKVEPLDIPKDVFEKVKEKVVNKFSKIHTLESKEERIQAEEKLFEDVLSQFDVESEDFNEAQIKSIFGKLEKQEIRELILHKNKRPDGRGFGDLRDISAEIAFLPRTHGSALFTRGQTQSLAVTTLGTSADEQMIDALEGESFKRFMLHYNFPPFSVGEVRPARGPGRREIGHGALAEKAIRPVMPSEEEFPYTVRIVSDILESNGSSSMATVCGATLALMDAGVPLKAPVAGIAIGMVQENNKSVLLTDIAGIEDHLGDMDFKVAGTKNGITAVQMDLKIAGINLELISKALGQALEARNKILEIINKVISEPRKKLSAYAPKITVIMINPEKIGEVIGPGGKIIKKIIEETGAKIDIEDSGKVFIAASSDESANMAIDRINAITEEAEVGKTYHGKIRKIMNFGAFCEILPGTDGLIHVSELSDGFVKSVTDVVKEGDEVDVKVIGIDPQGRINLSMKQVKKEKDTGEEKEE